jgi:hypothetical protein
MWISGKRILAGMVMAIAENYLRQVLNKIRVSLHTDFVSTEYIPPAEYVVANEALPEEIRQYYLRPL